MTYADNSDSEIIKFKGWPTKLTCLFGVLVSPFDQREFNQHLKTFNWVLRCGGGIPFLVPQACASFQALDVFEPSLG